VTDYADYCLVLYYSYCANTIATLLVPVSDTLTPAARYFRIIRRFFLYMSRRCRAALLLTHVRSVYTEAIRQS
jgi:hypothetical protein